MRGRHRAKRSSFLPVSPWHVTAAILLAVIIVVWLA